MGWYLLLRAPSLPELDALTRRVETTLDGMLAHPRGAAGAGGGFRACLPAGRDALGRSRNLDTSSLTTMFPFAPGALAMDGGVLYGIASGSRSPVVVDPFDPGLENANAVVATSGAGKSYFTKLLALRSLLTGVECLVIDPEGEHGAVRGRGRAAGAPRRPPATASTVRPPSPGRPTTLGPEWPEGHDSLAEPVAR